MLQSIRDRTYGWPALILFGAIIVIFVFFGGQSFNALSSSDSVARINGISISKSTFDAEFSRLKRSNPNAPRDALKKNALQHLIDMTLLESKIQNWGLLLNPKDLNDSILDIPQFHIDGHFSKERYLEVLAQNDLTPIAFKQVIQNELLQEQLQTAFSMTEFVLPQELSRQFGLLEQTREIQYVSLNAGALKTPVVSPTEVEISERYRKNLAQFTQPEKVKIEYILLDSSDLRQEIKLSAEQIQSYYTSHSEEFTLPVKKQLRHILIALKPQATEVEKNAALQKAQAVIAQLTKHSLSFEEAAKRYSEDRPSAASGGDMGWVLESELEPVLQQAAAGLQQPGQFTLEPVLTSFGFHILFLNNKTPPKKRPFNEVNSAISSFLVAQELSKKFQDERQRLLDLAYQHPDGLEAVAQAMNLKVQLSPWFETSGLGFPLSQSNPKVVEAAFSEPVLKGRNNSELLELNGTQAMVLRISEHVEQKAKPLSDVKDTLVKEWTQEKQYALLKQMGENSLTDFKSGKIDWGTFSKGQQVTVQKAKLGRMDQKIPQDILKLIFAMPRELTKKNKYLGAWSAQHSQYFLIELLSVKDADFSKAPADRKQSYTQGLWSFASRNVWDLFQLGLQRSSKIEYDASKT